MSVIYPRFNIYPGGSEQTLSVDYSLARTYYTSNFGHISYRCNEMDHKGVISGPMSTSVFHVPTVVHVPETNSLTSSQLQDVLDTVNGSFSNQNFTDPFFPMMPDIRFPSRTPVTGTSEVVLSLAKQLQIFRNSEDIKQVTVGGVVYTALRLNTILLTNTNGTFRTYPTDRPFWNTTRETLRPVQVNTQWSIIFTGIVDSILFQSGIISNYAPDLEAAGLDLTDTWAIFEIIDDNKNSAVSTSDFINTLDQTYPLLLKIDNTNITSELPLNYYDFHHHVGQMNIQFEATEETEIDISNFYSNSFNTVTINDTEYLVLIQQNGNIILSTTPNKTIQVVNGICAYNFVLRPSSAPTSSANDIHLSSMVGTDLSIYRFIIQTFQSSLNSSDKNLLQHLKLSNHINFLISPSYDTGIYNNTGTVTTPPPVFLSDNVYDKEQHGWIIVDEQIFCGKSFGYRFDGTGTFAAPIIHSMGTFLGLVPTFGITPSDTIPDTVITRQPSKTSSLDPLSKYYLQVTSGTTVVSNTGEFQVPMFMNFMDQCHTPNCFTHAQVFIARYALCLHLSSYISSTTSPVVNYTTNSAGRVVMPPSWYTGPNTKFVTPAVRNVNYDQIQIEHALSSPEIATKLARSDMITAESAFLNRANVNHLFMAGTPFENYLNDYILDSSDSRFTVEQSQLITTHSEQITNLINRVDINENDIETLGSVDSGLLLSISHLDQKTSDVSDSLNSIQTNLSDLHTDVSLLYHAVENIALQTNIADVSNALGELSADVSELWVRSYNIADDVSGLDVRTVAIQSDISGINTQLGTLRSYVDASLAHRAFMHGDEDNDFTARIITASQINTTSDIATKFDIKDIDICVDNLCLDVKPKMFKTYKNPSTQRFGFIAQNIKEHMPECIFVNRDGEMSIETTGILSALWKIVQNNLLEFKKLQTEYKKSENLLNQIAEIPSIRNWLKNQQKKR